MISALIVSTAMSVSPHQVVDYTHYTPEGYEVQRFDCDLTRCIGVDGTYIGHPDNVMNVLPAIKEEHAHDVYYCEGFCYDDEGFIIGVDPHR